MKFNTIKRGNSFFLCFVVFSLYTANASSNDLVAPPVSQVGSAVVDSADKDSSVNSGKALTEPLSKEKVEVVSKTTSSDKMSGESVSVIDRDKYEKQNAEIKKLQATQNELLLKVDELTKNMYLSNEQFGEKNGPGYFYRFSQTKGVKQSESGFYYYIYDDIPSRKGKRSNVEPSVGVIRQNDFVSFNLKEMLPDGKVISETPVLTLLNDDKLPDIVKAAFSVGKDNSTITIVTLAKQVYTDSNDYPDGVKPDTSIIYKFKIINVKNDNGLNLLKRSQG